MDSRVSPTALMPRLLAVKPLWKGLLGSNAESSTSKEQEWKRSMAILC